MYAGRVVEEGTLDEIFYDPQHPYTWGLLGSLTRLDRPRPQRLPQISGAPPSLLELPRGLLLPAALPARVRPLHRDAGARGAAARRPGPLRPLLARARAEARAAPGRRPDRAGGTGLMSDRRAPARGHRPGQALPDQARAADRPRGRSGAGGRRGQLQRRPRRDAGPGRRVGQRQVDRLPGVLQLLAPTSGSVRFEGREIAGLSRRQMRPLRRQMQMIFQDPYASLNPRKRVGQIVGDPLKLQGVASGAELRSAGAGAARAGRALAPSTTTATRTSSPAASGSGSGSPGRSR